ncbi:MAG: TIGR02646 family protein, partial [Deltaproteobacteria bacterium]|nr:TIGR02646 family protein [Deltaproteobacteria bacterium]
MRAITKGQEPRSLVEHRANAHCDYANYADKDGLRAALVRDQRGLCCYCMTRVEATGTGMKIEHWR